MRFFQQNRKRIARYGLPVTIARVYLATAISLSFPAYLISGFFVSLPIKITLFIVVTSFPGKIPFNHCYQLLVTSAVCRAFPCHLQPSQTASACISRSLTIRLWSAAHHRECHYDSACFQKKKGHGRTPGRLSGCTFQLSMFNEGTFQNVL